jgi:nucleoside-diphosphate-sugar epimerase
MLLGYEPQVPFEEGIKRSIEWVLAWNRQKAAQKE